MTSSLAAVVMAAGLGTRMRSERPKHLHPLLGRRLLDWAIEPVLPLGASPVVVVCSPATEDELGGTSPPDAVLAVQTEPRGTGDAVAAARPALEHFEGDVFVLDGAAPLLTSELLRALLDEHRRAGGRFRHRLVHRARGVPAVRTHYPGSLRRSPRDRRGRRCQLGRACRAGA